MEKIVWKEYFDSKKRPYYFNTETKERTWHKPKDFVETAATEVDDFASADETSSETTNDCIEIQEETTKTTKEDRGGGRTAKDDGDDRGGLGNDASNLPVNGVKVKRSTSKSGANVNGGTNTGSTNIHTTKNSTGTTKFDGPILKVVFRCFVEKWAAGKEFGRGPLKWADFSKAWADDLANTSSNESDRISRAELGEVRDCPAIIN